MILKFINSRHLFTLIFILFFSFGYSFSNEKQSDQIFIVDYDAGSIYVDPAIGEIRYHNHYKYQCFYGAAAQLNGSENGYLYNIEKDKLSLTSSLFIGETYRFRRNNRFITDNGDFINLKFHHPQYFKVTTEIWAANIFTHKTQIVKSIKLVLPIQRPDGTNERADGVITRYSFTADGKKLLCLLASHIPFQGICCINNLDNDAVQTDCKQMPFYPGDPFGWPTSLSPDGRYMLSHCSYRLVSHSRLVSTGELYISDTTGKNKLKIIQTLPDLPEQKDMQGLWNHVWSPDSKKILFVRRQNFGRGTVSIVDINTKKIKTLLDFKETPEGWNPYLEWTDKGILITCPNEGIFSMNAKEEKPMKIDLPKEITLFWNGRISPDGSKIMFIGSKDGTDITKLCQAYVFVRDLNTGTTIEEKLQKDRFIDTYQATWIYKDKPGFLSND